MKDKISYRVIVLSGILVMTILASFSLRLNEEPKDGFEKLFNGTDLEGWYIYLRNYGVNHDPKNIFQIRQDGVLYVTGEIFGYIATLKEYEDFHLKLEFKWGEKKWPPRLNQKRDSGICYFFPDDSPDVVWPKSIECQIQEGDVGDFWMIDSTSVVVDGERNVLKNYATFKKHKDNEKPNGEWNTVEVIAKDGNIKHIVNGVVVNEGNDPSVQKGKILLQSEGAEVYYRNVYIKTL